MDKILLILGGIINILLGVFHLFFWKIFNWSVVLQCLPGNTRGTVIVINISLSLAVFIFGYLSIFHYRELTETKMGRVILLSISIFYLARAIAGAIFFPLSLAETIIGASYITAIAALYFVPFLRSLKLKI